MSAQRRRIPSQKQKPKKPLKVATPYPLSLQDLSKIGTTKFQTDNNYKKRYQKLQKAARRIPKSVHKSALIPYLVRGITDYKEGRQLTALQKSIVLPIVEAGLSDKVIRRFMTLPPETARAFDKRMFTTKQRSAVDKIFRSHIEAGAAAVDSALKKSKNKSELIIRNGIMEDTHFVTLDEGSSIYDVIKTATLPEPECPAAYQLRLEYRGVTIHNIDEGNGGVEPYMITGMFRLPHELIAQGITDVMHEMAPPMVVKHVPENLYPTPYGYWYPSGGDVDANGNPVVPIQFYPQFSHTVTREVFLPFPPYRQDVEVRIYDRTTIDLCPFHRAGDLHFIMFSVWEEDEDQSAEIMHSVSNVMSGMGSALVGMVPVVGNFLMVAGLVLELIAWIAGMEDDHVADFVLVIGMNELEYDGYQTIMKRIVGPDGNDWTIHLGMETKKWRG